VASLFIQLVLIFTGLVVLATPVVLTWRPTFDGRIWRVVHLDALVATIGFH
jgi:hypothetical protein